MTDPFAPVRRETFRKLNRNLAEWVHTAVTGQEFSLRIPITGVSETDAIADWDQTLARVQAYHGHTGHGEVNFARRRWRATGVIDIPRYIVFTSAADASRFARADEIWDLAYRRVTDLRDEWPETQEIRRGVLNLLTGFPEDEWQRLLTALRWSEDHDVDGLLPRMVAIEGLDTKQVQRLWPTVKLLAGLGVRRNSQPIGEVRAVETVTFVRLLDDDLRVQAGGLGLFWAPPSELEKLQVTPRQVIICENLSNGYSFTDRSGTAVLAGKGNDVARFAEFPWVRDAEVLYWGDIDTYGFRILNLFRGHMRNARSVLMDETTLLANPGMWVREENQTIGELTELTAEEQKVYRSLIDGTHGDKVRLEQERIPWPQVVAALG
ncbi:Wadjet anti-phage system protein JetD domain-containing protein [Rathayibacter sp. YIM 133350]|uniref:Wadjet anti-phage system protein JetD domain-containing protein n=1 Tax=Rathayibacter sp. YIM 133350 TaxID=3131992 RepID=UPI00307F0FDD